MKLTRKQLRKLIKEFKIPDQMITPKIDIPGILSGDGFPPVDDNEPGGNPDDKCKNFEELHNAISALHGELTEYFLNLSVSDYEHLKVSQTHEFTDIPFDIAAENHGIYVAKELINKCGRGNSSIVTLMANPKVLLGNDPIRSYNQNFQDWSRQGIDRAELVHTIQILRHSIRRL